MVINARHMRNVPGRKTDVADAAWGAQLIEHGLVRPSFIPPRPTREQRDLTRYRKSVIEERGREVQRLHKVLEDSGVKLKFSREFGVDEVRPGDDRHSHRRAERPRSPRGDG